MDIDLKELAEKAKKSIENASSLEELEELRVKYLGRKGDLNQVLRSLGDLSLEKRKEIGPIANEIKDKLTALIADRKSEFENRKESLIDITKPGRKVKKGSLHPLTKVENEVRRIFSSLNFSIIDGPEAEREYYNFDALNIPEGHPARDMWDTFWIDEDSDNKKKIKEKGRLLLRTHTSPVQIRYMEENNPPFQIVVPGRVFRYEATDASHEINFYQLEGLMVGDDISLANFKYIMEEFLEEFFEEEIEFRFRPSYFPFVEPGIEVDIKFKNKKGEDEWLEILGAGMVHRNVFNAAGYNPDHTQGFAFGVGLDRLAMIKYNIPDIRLFYSGDLRFINQF